MRCIILRDMGLDLNLLRTFLSIYETRSVTRAAESLSLTQPTVSHALARMRAQLKTIRLVKDLFISIIVRNTSSPVCGERVVAL